MFRLEMQNNFVVVSGAANGIGTAIMIGLLREGAYPIGIDIEPFKESELDRKTRRFKRERFDFIEGDAADENQMKDALSRYEVIHGLVNNAGLLGWDHKHGGWNIETQRKMMRAHAETANVLIREVVPKMPRNEGSVVSISSIEDQIFAPDIRGYAAAKGAEVNLTLACAVDYGPDGIRFNVLAPGDVNTERNIKQHAENANSGTSGIAEYRKRTPLRRSGEVKEITDAVLFLLSKRSSYITGVRLVIDGGKSVAL